MKDAYKVLTDEDLGLNDLYEETHSASSSSEPKHNEEDTEGLVELLTAVIQEHKDEKINEEMKDDNFALPDSNDGSDPDRFTKEDEPRLFTENKGLIDFAINKFVVRDANAEDALEQIVESAAYFGFLKGVRSYRKSYEHSGCKFSTWVTTCMNNQIISDLKANRIKTWRQDSIDEKATQKGNKVDKDITIGDTLTDKTNVETQVYQSIVIDYLYIALDMLIPMERDVITKLYGIGGSAMTQKELGDVYHISQSAISTMKDKILGRLRAILMSQFGITSAT